MKYDYFSSSPFNSIPGNIGTKWISCLSNKYLSYNDQFDIFPSVTFLVFFSSQKLQFTYNSQPIQFKSGTCVVFFLRNNVSKTFSYFAQFNIFSENISIGPRSDHNLRMSVTHSLTHSLSHELVEN